MCSFPRPRDDRPGGRRCARAGLALLSLIAVSCNSAATSTTPAPSSPTPDSSVPNEWPMYGQNAARTSLNPGETAIVSATLARLVPRWQSFIGQGRLPPSGSPAVAAGRVFVGSSVREGDNFFAFDAASGRTLWTADVGHWPTDDSVGIGAGPAVTGGVVVAGGGDGAYYGLDAASGSLLWRHDLDAGPSGFAWASPLVAKGRAYVGVASEGGNPPVPGEVRALDPTTGALLALRRLVPDGERGASIWNSPALSPDGGTLVVTTGEDVHGYDGAYNRAIVALDPLTLEVQQADKQATPGLDLDFGTSPVIFRDGRGRTLVGANQKSGVFYAYVLADLAGGPLWQRALGISVGMMPAYDPGQGGGGTLFVAGDNGQLFAVDPATGVDRYPPLALGFTHANMAIANGLVFVSTGGQVLVLDGASGRLLRILAPDNAGASFSGVVVAGGFVYWLSGPYLNAWGLP
jgi:outer membrane protein assembly factor BamB